MDGISSLNARSAKKSQEGHPNDVDAPPLLLLFLQVGLINGQSKTARLSFSALGTDKKVW
jgi:hypothetical protein